MKDKFDWDKIDFAGSKGSGKKVTATCPACSHTRKKNKDRCLGVDTIDGKAHCNHCDAVSFKEDGKSDVFIEPKQYTLPKMTNTTSLPDNVVKYFKGRGISQKTLIEMKITHGEEWMPQKKEIVSTVKFNYYKNGVLTNVKYRTGDKKFKLHSGSELILYNIDSIKDSNKCYIVEGECFNGSAEVLTPKGWVRLDLYNNERVAQRNGVKSEFVKPLAYIKKEYKDDLIEFSNSQKYYSCTTKKHNYVVEKKGVKKKVTAEYLHDTTTSLSIKRVVEGNKNKGIELDENKLRLLIAISADMTVRKTGDIYGAFKKERKKERLVSLLDSLGIRYSLNIDGRGYYSFFIHREHGLNPFKIFPKEWYSLSEKQMKIVIDEILHWDGNSVPNRNQIEYSSKEIENATFIQTLSHLVGYTSTIIRRQNHLGKWFKVSILFSKKDTNTQALKKTKIKHDGFVYCVQVPSGELLIRQNECISIIGNCDALSLHEAGITNVVSVPNGTSLSADEKKLIEEHDKFNDDNVLNFEFLDNSMEYLEHIKEFVLFVDNDPAGRKLQRELIRRFSPENCSIVDSGKYKDANEYLVKVGKIELEQICNNAKNVPLDGVYTIDDEWGYIKDIFSNGYKKGQGIGHEGFDTHRKFRLGELTLINGVPNHGKTTYICWEMALTHLHLGWKWAIYSPENYPAGEIYISLIETISGKALDSEDNKITLEELEQTRKTIKDNFFVIDWEEEDKLVTVDMVLAKTKELVKRKGINGVLIDPWNDLYHKKGNGENTADYLQKKLSQIRRFKRKYNLSFVINAHPTAEAQRRKEQHNEQGERPYVCWFSDVADGAMWGNRVDNAITIYRNTPHESAWKTTEVHIQKVKFQKLVGIPTSQHEPIRMNFVNNRLVMEDGFDPLKGWAIKGEPAPKSTVIEQATERDFENSIYEGQGMQEVPF